MNRFLITLTVLTMLMPQVVLAQVDELYGDFREIRRGTHAGNLFRTTFYNDGEWGVQGNDPTSISGEWPINSGNAYLLDGHQHIGSEIIDANGDLKHIFSEAIGGGGEEGGGVASGDKNAVGEWITFLPLPGFANPSNNKIAMVKGTLEWSDSWPNFWPDKIDDTVDPGWIGSWNGYFGKNQFNADEESYYVADDDKNNEFYFFPDAADSSRRGLGLRMYVRGLQWSNPLVEDGIFTLYDIENAGTCLHDKMVFGFKIGNQNGGRLYQRGDGQDDCGAFIRELNLAYLWDNDWVGVAGQTDHGYFGGAFLESPGNAVDGIDNDGDANGVGPVITEAMFEPFTLEVGQPIILIDYDTFERTVTDMPNDTIKIAYQDLWVKFWPGKLLEEDPFNLIDDNLNGLIDENKGATIGEGATAITRYLYVGAAYVDYFTGAGKENLLIDEARDDGIDNDGDWNPETDDVGLDGAPFTGDPGENDGLPTSGAGTEFPGEPHIDKTDINETDMLGLTSFMLSQDFDFADDEKTWSQLKPGILDDIQQNAPTDLLYGSGYFPMMPGQIERFSMAFIIGDQGDKNPDNPVDLIENKKWFSYAYEANYQFAKAPNLPTVRAVVGNKKVTLVWDDAAEKSVDPILGKDFEGYRIYRSTDPSFREMAPITDGKGSITYRRPLAQFDLDNEYVGYAEIDIKGVKFWLGENNGIVHSWTDTNVVNGYDYFYAVTAYDHGDPSQNIPPSETQKSVAISSDGSIIKGNNVVIVRPEAPTTGYQPATSDSVVRSVGSLSDGYVTCKVIFPQDIQDGHLYRVTFEDTLVERQEYPASLNFSLIDVTDGDTLIKKSQYFSEKDEQPIIEGFQIAFHDVVDVLSVNEERTGWNNPNVYPLDVGYYKYYHNVEDYQLHVGDLELIIGDVGIDSSTAFKERRGTLPAIPVNFKIWNRSLNREMNFAFREEDVNAGEEGMFTGYVADRRNRSDEIIILDDSLRAGWQIKLSKTGPDTLQPSFGDEAVITFNKPFLSNDVFEFALHAETSDIEKAKQDLDQIRVVPNPYIVSNTWEPVNQYTTGRGPRELHFTHLPPRCTIRIFNMGGQLVDMIEHDMIGVSNDESGLWNGTAIWDMRSKDDLDIAYGIYFYHVEAEGIGEKVGKFAIIK